MKIKELLVNGLMMTSIFEMAFEKKVAMDKARNLQMQIAKHLVKINMFKKSSLIKHWTNEVNTWLLSIQDNWLKGTNRPLKERDLFKILFDEPVGSVDEVQWHMNKAYKEYPDLYIDQPNAAEINKILNWQLQKICNDIEKKQFTDIRNYK